MTENKKESMGNPFDRPRTKVAAPLMNKANLNKKIQMQKVDYFRDQLNRELFGNIDQGFIKEEDVFTKKEYKVPPKIYKRPEMPEEINRKDEVDNNNACNIFTNQKSVSPINPLSTKNSDKKLSDIFNTKNDNLLGNNIFNTSEDNENINMNDLKPNKSQTEIENSIKNNNQKISFSEENCNSLVYSENKDIKADIPSETSSNDKKHIMNLDSQSYAITEVFNNSNNESNMYKIEKNLKFSKIENDKNLSNSGSKSVKPVPINSSRHQKNNYSCDSNSNLKEKSVSIKSVSDQNKDEVCDPNNFNEESNNLNASLTSLELSKKLENLKSEIRNLKEIKSVLETNYEIEKKKSNSYEKEMQILGQQLDEFKTKKITEGETMLKLEIMNLNNEMNFFKKENEILKKENEIYSKEVLKLQEYVKEMLNKGKSDLSVDQINKNTVRETVPLEEVKNCVDQKEEGITTAELKKENVKVQIHDSIKMPSPTKSSHPITEKENIIPISIFNNLSNNDEFDFTSKIQKSPINELTTDLTSDITNAFKDKPNSQLINKNQEQTKQISTKENKNIFEGVSDKTDLFTLPTRQVTDSKINEKEPPFNKKVPPNMTSNRNKNTMKSDSKNSKNNSFVKSKENQEDNKQNSNYNVFAFDINNEDVGNIFGAFSKGNNKETNSIFD